jgi:hypothetical protein
MHDSYAAAHEEVGESMHIEISDTFLDELRHTAHKLGEHPIGDMDNDVLTAYKLLESIIGYVEQGASAAPRIIKRENEQTGDMHTHVLLTSFCLSNEWLGENGEKSDG